MSSPPSSTLPGQTRVVDGKGDTQALLRRRARLVLESGPHRGDAFALERQLHRIGRSRSNDVVLRDDDSISAHHAELDVSEAGFLLRDLGSTNGTRLGAWRIREALLEPEVPISFGNTVARFEVGDTFTVPLGRGAPFGIIGEALTLREALGLVERFATSDHPVLIQGETGTGKEQFARALHQLARRRAGPFVVFDCGAVSPTLIEAEIFGHVPGAFTGAVSAQAGVFERANGGTLFIDEVGELPLDLQPKLLRVLEDLTLRRLGETRSVEVDLRVVAATHRDLGAMVERGEFRADLFYRLSALMLEVPPLRSRKSDIRLLSHHLLGEREIAAEALALLEAYDWPGNVRELRNVLARALAMSEGKPLGAEDVVGLRGKGGAATAPIAAHLSYHEAKDLCLDAFERAYVAQALQAHQGNLTRAAEAAQIPPQTLRRLAGKHGLRRKTSE
jgi:DNA-binding NtrC family response regulator